MTTKIDEQGLKALIDSEISNALGYVGKLSSQRQKALWYYYGEAKLELAPPEVDGRSSVVSNDTADTIEWIMPSLCKIFTGSDDAVEFTPQGEEDVDGAEQATAYANYVFYRQNKGFTVLHNWFKDALLQKAGIVKVWWDNREDVKKEEYEGLTLDELTLMVQDKACEIVEARSYPDPDQPPMPAAQAINMGVHPAMQPQGQMVQPGAGAGLAGGMPAPMQPGAGMQPPGPPSVQGMPQPSMLYDVTVRRTKKSAKTCVENIPPEEFLLSRRARTMDEPFFVGHRVMRTASDLRAMGYSKKEVDDLSSDETWTELNPEHIERLAFDDEVPAFRSSEGGDPARRVIWLTECYLPVDWDGDGIAELRRVVKCGTKILENEAVDDHPFCLITPIMMPHRVIGLSVADIVQDIHRIKTVMLRQYLDSLYLSNNPRVYVDTTKGVNLDDLLMVRPGGVVRGQGPNAVEMLVTPHAGQNSLEGLAMMDNVLEDRTGVTKMNNVTNPQSLNKTATEVNAMSTASNQRIELIARVFAETGVSELFRKIIKLGSQHAERATMLRLQGKFVAVDPRTWKNQFDVTVNVGLGSGNKDQIVQHMMMVLQAQEKAIQLGLADPKTIFEALSELTRAIGHKDVTRFWVNPASPEWKMPPPQPNPAVQVAQIKAQADTAIAQHKAQTDMQSKQADLQADVQSDQARAQADERIAAAKAQAQSQADTIEANNDMHVKLSMHAADQDTAIKIAKINALAKIEAALVSGSKQPGEAGGIVKELGSESGVNISDVADRIDDIAGVPTGKPTQHEQTQAMVQGLGDHINAMHQGLTEHLQNVHRALMTPNEIVRHPTSGQALGTRKTLQ